MDSERNRGLLEATAMLSICIRRILTRPFDACYNNILNEKAGSIGLTYSAWDKF